MNLAQSILEGNRLALARSLTLVENDHSEGQAVLSALFPYTGRAHLVGVTGATGTGKSSLVSQLALYFRKPPDGIPPRRVAIVAVDPSSPFTGGAILGDRIRMRDLGGDPGVFIRSMATRGSLGGLAAATASVVQVFDAAGYEMILIETVGAGQTEIEIARLAHTTLVLETPGLGDDIQAIKAGILEIADILVINKADREGASRTYQELVQMLELQAHRKASAWKAPVLLTQAKDDEGIEALMAAVRDHQEFLAKDGGQGLRLARGSRVRQEFLELLKEGVSRHLVQQLESDGRLDRVLKDILEKQTDPYSASEALVLETLGPLENPT